MLGTWRNADAGSRGVSKIRVDSGDGGLRVEVWGRCLPIDCAWGQTKLHRAGPNYRAAYTTKFALRTLILVVERETLVARVETRFIDGSGRSDIVDSLTAIREH